MASLHDVRKELAAKYLSGSGVEIGALHFPLPVPSSVKVRYIDRMPVSQLRTHYPELVDYCLVKVDILDDGEKLSSVSDESVDFVVGNHLIEHTQNPISSLQNWLRVLKPNGVLYMGIPHKYHTFDKDRPVSTLDHIVRDYTDGPEWSRRYHLEEWARLVDRIPEEQVGAHVQYLIEFDYSIHYHVWTEVEFLELLLFCRKSLSFPFEIELVQKNDIEFIVILRKHDAK
jgi:predicted SAM-dependent methyltransferase